VFLLYDGVQSLDVCGPLEVFGGAERLLRGVVPGSHGSSEDRGYRLRTLSRDGLAVRSSSGLTIVPEGSLRDAPAAIHTLIIPGGAGSREACEDPELVAWIERAAPRAKRVAAVCTGAFLLARAGLLAGRRATTHWAAAGALARLHPDVAVDPEPIFVRDGHVWTSAGVTAGIDLALALVEEDLDREAALTIARHLVVFLRRPGSQSQFSATLASQEPTRDCLREVQREVVEDIGGEHTVDAMAARAHMSPRHFARAFRAETGLTPARYVERVRVEAARRCLEDSYEPIAQIAARCGFGSAETMRRAFVRILHVSPAEYRRRLGPEPARSRPKAPLGAHPQGRTLKGTGRHAGVA
jgi:transcriptional regulator GlxA family with amidase domain